MKRNDFLWCYASCFAFTALTALLPEHNDWRRIFVQLVYMLLGVSIPACVWLFRDMFIGIDKDDDDEDLSDVNVVHVPPTLH